MILPAGVWQRGVGVLVGLALLSPIGRLLVIYEPDKARLVADFPTAFNLALAFVFFPFLKPYAVLLGWLFPARTDPLDPSRPLCLDPAALKRAALRGVYASLGKVTSDV